jgi:competence protein ComGC
MDIMTIVLLVISVMFLFLVIFSRRAQSKVEDKLIRVVMDIHDQSRFYHNAGRSSAEHQLQVERMNIEKLQAEADKAKYEAHRMEEERLQKYEVGGFKEPKHGKKGHKRTVIEQVGGVNG